MITIIFIGLFIIAMFAIYKYVLFAIEMNIKFFYYLGKAIIWIFKKIWESIVWTVCKLSGKKHERSE